MESPSAADRAASAFEVRGLTKRFGDVVAVAAADFDVHGGEFFGFLGPNGAGKTTTIDMLIGLARPDAGSIRIAGIDCSRNPKAAQHLLGIVPEDSNLYPELTGFENLCLRFSLRTRRLPDLALHRGGRAPLRADRLHRPRSHRPDRGGPEADATGRRPPLRPGGRRHRGGRRIRPSLEDVFVRITGIALDEMKRDKEKRLPKSNGGSPS